MRSTWVRVTVTTGIAAAVTIGAIIGAGTASGTAQPVVIGSCATTVQGAPGTPVELSPAAVVSPIATIIKGAGPLGLGATLVAPFESAFDAMPPIPIGALPTGKSTITGGTIANAVVAQLNKLPVLGPVLSAITAPVEQQLASLCGVTVDGVNAAAAPVQQGSQSIATAAQKAEQQAGLAPKSSGTSGSGSTPGKTGSSGGSGGGSAPLAKQGGGSGGTSSSGSGLPSSNSPVLGGLPTGFSGTGAGALLDFGLAESPLARYAGIPFASSGLFTSAPGVKYGGVPGYAPATGQLGQDNGNPSDGVQTAGQAVAFHPGGGLGNSVGLPMLLAVLLLAGVTAALVRTWVLRRVHPA